MRATLPISLVSGFIAITTNTLVLKLADLLSLPTAHGGLWRLVATWLSRSMQEIGIGTLWMRLGGPPPSSPFFQVVFHVVVGIAMALVYGFLIERLWRGHELLKGNAIAAFVWILNAAVVLPLTGEGFAGSEHLSVAGTAWFAMAHTLFSVLLALLFRILDPRTVGQD